jgi:hypothetical protein
MKSAKIIFIILFLLGVFISPQSAHADMAPPPEVELGGLLSFQDTEVQMMYERVELELQMFYSEDGLDPIQNRVVVNAYFVMKNQGVIDESMQAVFPSQSLPICHGNTSGDSFTFYNIIQDSFEVAIDGVVVPTSVLEAPYGECLDYPWLAFDINFPVNKEVLVKVSYIMETFNVDSAQNIDYILETGAGWKGKIGRGYIILKFPYAVTSENVLSGATKGYQILYNEVFWSFQDLEPTSENNIHISIVSPNVWLEIQSLRAQIEKDPELPNVWLRLIDLYAGVTYSNKGIFIRDKHYFDLIESTYTKAIAANPNSAEILASYAGHKLSRGSPHGEPITEDQAKQVFPLLNKALALDANNETALYVLLQLKDAVPFITFTPPATIPPTATSVFTITPSVTPSATITPIPSETPIVVTVVHTKIVDPPASTPEPLLPTATSIPTQVTAQTENQKGTSTPLMIFGALVVFIAGMGAGTFWSKRTGT